MNETTVPFKEILKNVLSSSSEKLKNSIFEIPIIPQTLRITSAKSINLNIIRKLIKKCRVKAKCFWFTLTIFKILLFKCRSHTVGYRQEQKGKILTENQKNVWLLLELLEK